MVPDTASRLPLIETNKKMEHEFVLQICNHQITHMQQHRASINREIKTFPSELDASAVAVRLRSKPGRVRSLLSRLCVQKFSTVCKRQKKGHETDLGFVSWSK